MDQQQHYQKEINKDMRICYLSVLSTIASKEPDMDLEALKERAKEITEYIFELYPYPNQYYNSTSQGEVRMNNPEPPKAPKKPF